MKLTIKYVLLTVSAILLSLSGTYSQTSGAYVITGKDALLASQKIYLLSFEKQDNQGQYVLQSKPKVCYLPYLGIKPSYLDSTQVAANGTFELKGALSEPGVYVLRIGQQRLINPIPLNYGSRVTVAAHALVVDGRKVLMLQPGDSPDLELFYQTLIGNSSYEELPTDSRTLVKLKTQLRQNAGSYLAPYLAYRYLRFQPSQRQFMDSLLVRFTREQPQSPYVAHLREALNGTDLLPVNQLAPDISLPGPDGKSRSLESLRGKYVLLTFWASWCSPCRANRSSLWELYSRFYNRGAGFTVYTVSLDEHLANWLYVLPGPGDNQWTHVVAPEGFQSKTARRYRVATLPAALLLDPQGRIVIKNPTNSELWRTLERVLK